MPVFEYTALNARGKRCKGILDADNAQMAALRLKESKFFPINIKESSSRKEDKRSFSASLFKDSLSRKERSLITRQLATMMEAGFPLLSALNFVIGQTGSTKTKGILSRIKDDIEQGLSFADALERESDSFSATYINMVHSGESSGTLELVLLRLAELLENQENLKSHIKSALAYPILMAVFGTLVLFALMTLVVPGLVSIFEDMNKTLPLATRALLSLSYFLKNFWWLILLFFFLLVFLFKLAKKSEKSSLYIDSVILKIPIIGPLICKLALTRCFYTLASLLSNGIPILNAMNIAESVVNNKLLARTIARAAKAVEKGDGIADSLAAGQGFPEMALQMIQIGEKSADLEKILEKVADIYQNESQNTIRALSSMLEPLVILFMGIAVGLIVLAICLPIFEMNQLVL